MQDNHFVGSSAILLEDSLTFSKRDQFLGCHRAVSVSSAK
jgi:hypothetical protein